jgi:hypothetical protein
MTVPTTVDGWLFVVSPEAITNPVNSVDDKGNVAEVVEIQAFNSPTAAVPVSCTLLEICHVPAGIDTDVTFDVVESVRLTALPLGTSD